MTGTSNLVDEKIKKETSGIYTKIGKQVYMNVGTWTDTAGLTIPSEYRPAATVQSVCEQRTSAGVVSINRITINTNGTVSLPVTNATAFLGSFTWLTS